ncbi:MAG: hypothetical protein AB7E24_09785 [Novosphingobium sp.]
MKAHTALPVAMAAVLALAGCKKDKAPEQADAAGGEILPRSVSDDMPPYDTVRSQAPLANPEEGSSGDVTKPATAQEEEAATEEAAPEPQEDSEAAATPDAE